LTFVVPWNFFGGPHKVFEFSSYFFDLIVVTTFPKVTIESHTTAHQVSNSYGIDTEKSVLIDQIVAIGPRIIAKIARASQPKIENILIR
jgi:hypothetical protein